MKEIEKSLFMLKPEAMLYKEEIMSKIKEAGIPIKEWRNLTLDENHLKSLYPPSNSIHPEENWRKTKKYLLGKEVLVAIVEGDDVIKKLYELCGEKVYPFMCKKDSIRYMFKDIAHYDESFSENVIHRAKDEKEAKEQIILFFPPERI